MRRFWIIPLFALLLNPASSLSQEVISGRFRTTGGGGPSAFSYVTNSATGCINNNAVQTLCTFLLRVNPAAGSLITCQAYWGNSTATAAMSSTNNTWTAIGSPEPGGGSLNTYRTQMFRVLSSNAGADTVTLTLSSATSIGMGWECAQYTYTGTLSNYNGTPVYCNGAAVAGVITIPAATGCTSTSLTLTGTSNLLFANCMVVDTACTVGAGFTARNDASGACLYNGTTCTSTTSNYATTTGNVMEEKTGVGAGAAIATFGAGTTDNNAVGLVAYGT